MTFLYGGFLAGILYRLLAVFRRRFSHRAVTVIADALFALLLTLVTGASFLLANGGALRLYGFLLIGAGALISGWAFQPLFSVL